MLKFIIQFLLIFVIWHYNNKNKGGMFTPSGVLLSIYTLCSFMGIMLLCNGEFQTALQDRYWFPMIIFDLFIILYLLPFYKYNETQINNFKIPNKTFLDVFSTIIIILSIYSILFFAKSVIGIFSMGDLGEARNARYGSGGVEYFEAGLQATIASVAAANYCFAIVLFFIYAIIGNSKKRCILLLLSSISEPVHVLAFVGRDGIVFWLFTFAFCYAFFRPFLQESIDKQIRKICIIGGSILLIPFMLITISRFALSDYMGGGTGNSMVAYMGQPFVQGPLFFGIDNKPIRIGSAFPLFYEITNTHQLNNNIADSEIGEWRSWIFSSFIVSLYQNLDLFGLIVVTILTITFFYFSIGYKKDYIDLGNYTIYLLLFQIIGQGVFYFRQGNRGGNLFIISTLFLAILFSHCCRHWNNPIILRKNGTT